MHTRLRAIIGGLLDPAFIIILLAVFFTILRAEPGQRFALFAITAATGVGAVEIVKGIRSTKGTPRFGSLAHVIAGSGWLLVGFGVLQGNDLRMLIPAFVLVLGGSILSAVGSQHTRMTNGVD